MIQLVYVSKASRALAVEELFPLLSRSRIANAMRGVTGILLYQHGGFLQVLEGEPDTVDAVFARIGRDPRHGHLVVLIRREIRYRNFADWSMGFVDLTRRAIRLPGFRANSSFADLAGEPEIVLEVLQGFRDPRWRQVLMP